MTDYVISIITCIPSIEINQVAYSTFAPFAFHVKKKKKEKKRSKTMREQILGEKKRRT